MGPHDARITRSEAPYLLLLMSVPRAG